MSQFFNQPIPWPQPQNYPPLPGREGFFPNYMPLPLLSAAVDEAQNNIKAPRPLIFSTALAAIAVAIQGLFDVRKPNGQRVPLSLMLLTIANSGERKSTVENVFLGAIRTVQKQQNLIYQTALNEWKTELHIWETKKKAILKSIHKKAIQEEPSDDEDRRFKALESAKPTKPKQFKLLYEDATSEALFRGLHQDLPTAGLISSEGGGILNGRALNDLSKQNALWSGDSITVDRVSIESYVLADARLTVSIMAQESAFQNYMEQRGEQSRGSGLWARFLVCQPLSTQGSRTIENGTWSSEHGDKFAARLSELLQLNQALMKDSGRAKGVINFSPEASERWLNVFNAIEVEIRPNGRFAEAGDHASKLADNIARVAALFHCFEGFEGDISLDTVNSAINLCAYYSDEFIKLFIPPPQEETDANDLYYYLQNAMIGCMNIPKNHILKFGRPPHLREKSRLNPALEILCQQGRASVFLQGRTTYISLGI